MRQATPLTHTHTHTEVHTHTQVQSMLRSALGQKEFISLAKGLITFSVHLAPLATHALLSNANQQPALPAASPQLAAAHLN